MSQVTTNLQIDFCEWVCSLEHVFFSSFFYLCSDRKTNNFTRSNSTSMLSHEIHCSAALYSDGNEATEATFASCISSSRLKQ